MIKTNKQTNKLGKSIVIKGDESVVIVTEI